MSDVELAVRNAGGITQKEVEIDAGTTLVVGTNASNKTSLLRSFAFALGADDVPIRSGADEAVARIDYDGRTVECRARANGAGVEIDGEDLVPDDDDRQLVERFACLLGTNPLRGAVARGENVGDLLKQPMEIEALEDERSASLDRKRKLQAELEASDGVTDRLRDRREELAATRDRIADLEDRLEALYDQRETTGTEDERLASLREERTSHRTERDRDAQLTESQGARQRAAAGREPLQALRRGPWRRGGLLESL